MMNFTSSASDLECLLLKFKEEQDFASALKVSNILEIVYAGDQDLNKSPHDRAPFHSLHLALHIMENDLEGARFMWKRAPISLKTNEASELNCLWTLAKTLIAGDASAALLSLIEMRSRLCHSLGTDVVDSLLCGMRNQLWMTILASYDEIELNSAADMLHLEASECKKEFLSRGCTYHADRNFIHISAPAFQTAKDFELIDDGSLMRTLTECVAQLERQPLSIDIKKEIEKAQMKVVSENETMAMET